MSKLENWKWGDSLPPLTEKDYKRAFNLEMNNSLFTKEEIANLRNIGKNKWYKESLKQLIELRGGKMLGKELKDLITTLKDTFPLDITKEEMMEINPKKALEFFEEKAQWIIKNELKRRKEEWSISKEDFNWLSSGSEGTIYNLRYLSAMNKRDTEISKRLAEWTLTKLDAKLFIGRNPHNFDEDFKLIEKRNNFLIKYPEYTEQGRKKILEMDFQNLENFMYMKEEGHSYTTDYYEIKSGDTFESIVKKVKEWYIGDTLRVGILHILNPELNISDWKNVKIQAGDVIKFDPTTGDEKWKIEELERLSAENEIDKL